MSKDRYSEPVQHISFRSSTGRPDSLTPGADTYYLPPGTAGLLVKVRLSDLPTIGSLDATSGAGSVLSAVIDPIGGNALLGVFTESGSAITAVRLSDFSARRHAQLAECLAGERGYRSARWICILRFVRQRSGDHSDSTSPISRMPGRSSSLPTWWTSPTASLVPGPASPYSASYAERYYYRSELVRVRLADFTYAGRLVLNEKYVSTGVIDPSVGVRLPRPRIPTRPRSFGWTSERPGRRTADGPRGKRRPRRMSDQRQTSGPTSRECRPGRSRGRTARPTRV